MAGTRRGSAWRRCRSAGRSPWGAAARARSVDTRGRGAPGSVREGFPMRARTVGAARVAVIVLACKGETGAAGPQGDRGPQGDIGPPGVGWADAGSDLVTTNSGNVGIGTAAPGAKLDVN